MPCLIKPDMHHTWLCIMPWLCLVVYHVVFFFPVVLLLDSSSFVAIVRIRSTTPVRLLHGFDLLPSGISGKMTVTLDLTTIFAMLVVSMLSLCRATYHLFIKPPMLPWQPLTFLPFLANRCLAMLPLCSAPLIALLVAGAVAGCSMLGHGYLGISQYLLFNYCIYIHGKGWKARPFAWCFVPLLPS